MKLGTEVTRLFQHDREPIPSLSKEPRFIESAKGAVKSAISGIGDFFRGRFVSAIAKEGEAVLRVGDIATGAVADGVDAALNVDTIRKRSGAALAQAA